MRWRDLDLATGTMAVRQSVAMVGGKPTIQAPKSRAAERTILLPAEAVAALRLHKDRQAFARAKVGELWADLDLVVATGAGGPLRSANVTRAFGRIVERAGVPRIRFHDLRHTHATWLIAAGHPITAVSERLGHAKVSITLDTYAHVVAKTRDWAAEAVSALLFGPDKGTEGAAAAGA